MARRRFGGTIGGYVVRPQNPGGGDFTVVFAPGATVTFWADKGMTTRYTDLQDSSGQPISQVTAGDPNGRLPEFLGPDTNPETWAMWASADGGEPALVAATDVGDAVSGLTSQVNQNTADLNALVLDDLSDVDTMDAQDGYTLVFVAATGTWVPADAGGGGATTLDGLADVDATAPADDQVLAWDEASGTWVPRDPATGSGTVQSINGEEPDASGNVALSASDVNALPETQPVVTEVDGQSGIVDLSNVYATDSALAGHIGAVSDHFFQIPDVERSGDGSWPFRPSHDGMVRWYDTDYANPQFPGDANEGDLYIGPGGMV